MTEKERRSLWRKALTRHFIISRWDWHSLICKIEIGRNNKIGRDPKKMTKHLSCMKEKQKVCFGTGVWSFHRAGRLCNVLTIMIFRKKFLKKNDNPYLSIVFNICIMFSRGAMPPSQFKIKQLLQCYKCKNITTSTKLKVEL